EQQCMPPGCRSRCVIAWSGHDPHLRTKLKAPLFSQWHLRDWPMDKAEGYEAAWRSANPLQTDDSASLLSGNYPDDLRPSLVHRFLAMHQRCPKPVTRGKLFHFVVDSLREEIREFAVDLAQHMKICLTSLPVDSDCLAL